MSSKHKSSDGDWTCSDVKCNNLNFARRSSCNRCGKEREPSIDSKKNKQSIEIGKAAAEKSHGLFSADDWQCSKCGNVNWARRNTCNMCNAPKVGEVEERTGYGGGFNEREGVEYIRREESDDEFDEFGLRKKKFRGALPPVKSIAERPTVAADDDKEKLDDNKDDNKDDDEDDDDDDEDDDDDDDSADLSKYDLCGDEDDIDLDEKKEYSSKDTKATNKNNANSHLKPADHTSRSRSLSRSYSRSHSGSSRSSRSRSYSKDGTRSSNSRSQSPKTKSGRKSRSRSREAGRSKRSFGSNSSYSSKSRSRSRSRSFSKDKKIRR